MDKKELYCFFNGPLLGGAERSFTIQSRDATQLFNFDTTYFIPFLESKKEAEILVDFLLENKVEKSKIVFLQVDKVFYQLSRENLNSLGTILKIPWALLNSLKSFINNIPDEESLWWISGNKVGILCLLVSLIKRNKRFLWHFRDYPISSVLFKLLLNLIRIFKNRPIEFIGNSIDVSKKIYQSTQSRNVYTLYNPVGRLKVTSKETESISIGTASMFAPWKGIHTLVFFANLYREKLENLGISEFCIFGDEVYNTFGDHLGYKAQLQNLNNKIGSHSRFVSFKGLKTPTEIFSDLDIFIHSSLKPEPFGRVLLESYASGCNLISTGLGGAAELIENNITGYTYSCYDYESLFKAIENTIKVKSEEFRKMGLLKVQTLKSKYNQQLVEIFSH